MIIGLNTFLTCKFHVKYAKKIYIKNYNTLVKISDNQIVFPF